jgi:outer membrane protein, heavy metal efflux system
MNSCRLAVLAVSTLLCRSTFAEQSPGHAGPLTFREFLTLVERANLELSAERANVTMAEARALAARMFPEPTLTAGIASIDVSRRGSPTATTLGVGATIELGGKRTARIASARGLSNVARTELEDFWRNLRADAANAWITAASARMVLERKRQALRNLERLVEINQQRLAAGDIGTTALMQSRVEARHFQGDVLDAEADLKTAELALVLLANLPRAGDDPIVPAALPRSAARAFDEAALVEQALADRSDARSRRGAVAAAQSRIRLARANRWIDLSLNLGWQHSQAASHEFAAPAFDALAATVTMPLPFSRLNRGELDESSAGAKQAEDLLRATERKIEVEIRQALTRYRASRAKLDLFTSGLLADAQAVRDAFFFNYQRGGCTLLELLEAERTLNDVQLDYVGALREHAVALVSVEQAAGIWDLEL